MREDLLGYLLSALEPHEMRRVELELRTHPALQEELEFLRRTLAPLDHALAELPVVESPSDLVARTMAILPPLPTAALPLDTTASAAPAANSIVERASMASVKMAPINESRRPYRASWSDLLVAGTALAAIFALLIPAIARGRYEARRIACQDHLRQMGTAIKQYVMLNRNESLPQIAENGPEAFAGVYAVRLNDSGLLPNADVRWCPERSLPPLPLRNENGLRGDMPVREIPVRNEGPLRDGKSIRDAGPSLGGPGNSSLAANRDDREELAADLLFNRIVGSNELQRASEQGDVDHLRWAQQTAGGHFAYNLGVVDEEQYETPRYEGRATFAVLGDSPIAGTEAADAVDASRLRWGHRDSGANVLFEDGSVRFLDIADTVQLPDHPYFNHRGSVEAGVNIDDASLAPSWRPPFFSVRQR